MCKDLGGLGKTWKDLKVLGVTWKIVDGLGKTWNDLDGLRRTWEDLEEHWRTRKDIKELESTWKDLEGFGGDRQTLRQTIRLTRPVLERHASLIIWGKIKDYGSTYYTTTFMWLLGLYFSSFLPQLLSARSLRLLVSPSISLLRQFPSNLLELLCFSISKGSIFQKSGTKIAANLSFPKKVTDEPFTFQGIEGIIQQHFLIIFSWLEL